MTDPAYSANFFLQAIVLSGLWLGVVACLRGCERRARAALVGILVCGVAPFLSVVSPVKEIALPGEVARLQPPVSVPPPTMGGVETHISAPVMETAPVARLAPEIREPIVERRDPVSWLIFGWLGGSLLGAGWMARELMRSRRWLRSASVPSESEWEKVRDHLPRSFLPDRVRLSAAPHGPCVIGFWKPRIVIPRWLLETHDRRELAWTLRHEWEHLRGNDSRWIHIVSILRIVQWWNPLLHLLAGIWSQAREQTCDLRAAPHPDERPDYGHFLLKIAGGTPRGLATSMAVRSQTKRLRRRIVTMISSRSGKPAPASPGWTPAMGCMMALTAAFTSIVGFANPSPAKSPDEVASTDDLGWLNPLPIVHLQTAVVISAEPFAKQGEILTDTELKGRLNFAGRKGFHFQPLVRTNSPPGAHLTATRDPSMTAPPWDGSKIIDPFVGWMVHYEPLVSKDDVILGVKAAYAFPPGSHPAPGNFLHNPRPLLDHGGRIQSSDVLHVLPAGMLWSDVVMATADGTAKLHSGKILCTSLGEVEPGVHAICLTGLITRMPWERSSMSGFPALSAPSPDFRDITPTRGVPLERTPEQETLAKEHSRLLNEFLAKVDAHPANRSLQTLRSQYQRELDEKVKKKETDKEAELQWKIRKITERMQENARGDFGRERQVIEELGKTISDGSRKWFEKRIEEEHRKMMEDSRREYELKQKNRDPNRFENREQ